MSQLTLKIVTPEGNAYSDQVNYVTLPGQEGELGIFPKHVPLMTRLKAGEVHVRKENEEVYLAIGEGFAEITSEQVAILTDSALTEAEIDEDAVEKAIARAKEALSEKLSSEEIATTEALISRSLAQLKLKRRRRGG
ncbi:MAG: ATP synthase F1 subunit epsilon [Verrucomicrobiae bacterium]|nr:ATP synthase F1 subunit epsilon [Verrucomicrobiae bacterium]